MQSRFAPVAPIQVLRAMYKDSPQVFGDYHLFLAHHTVAYKRQFKELMRRMEGNKFAPTIIMDNSVVELGGAVDFDMIREATDIVCEGNEHAICIPVLPDIMGDGQKTRVAIKQCYDQWSRNMPGHGFMAVMQGNSWKDYCTTLSEVGDTKRYPEITWLGIPRILVKHLGTRKAATQRAIKTTIHNIHMLGFSDDMADDFRCTNLNVGRIRGIDSAVPLRIPTHFALDLFVNKRPEAWFLNAKYNPTMKSNIEVARGLL